MKSYSLISIREAISFKQNKFYYTDIESLFQAAEIHAEKYNWLLAAYECNYYPNAEWENSRHEYIWLSGKYFSEILKNNPRLQFIWGTITAFESALSLEDILSYGIPSTDKKFNYEEKLELQNVMSSIEIGSIDSSIFFVISKEEKYIHNLKKNFKLQ